MTYFQNPSQFANTARLIRSVAATSDANGKITFSLGPAEAGSVYEGSVQVPNAPSGALFVATILGANWGQFAGPVNFGPIQMYGGEVLQVVGTGLTPSTGFVLTLFGISMPEELATPIPPAAPMSVVTVETSTKLVNGVTLNSAQAATGVTVTPPSLTRRLTLAIESAAGNSTRLFVQGKTSGINYFSAEVLDVSTTYFLAIEPTIDDSYLIFTSGSFSGTFQLWVVASSTNPVIDTNPLHPVSVVGPQAPFASYPPPVFTYERMRSQSSITGFSGGPIALISTAAGFVAQVGTVSVTVTAGRDLVSLESANGVFWKQYVCSDGPATFQVYYRGLVGDTIFARAFLASTIVTATWEEVVE